MAAALRTYQLSIEISKPVRVRIGRLGTFDFPAGRYTYTGSALRNIEARIARHLSSTKKMHWHIDYLLAVRGVRVVAVKRFCEPECVVSQRTVGDAIIKGFGATDCRAGCGSHLKRIG